MTHPAPKDDFKPPQNYDSFLEMLFGAVSRREFHLSHRMIQESMSVWSEDCLIAAAKEGNLDVVRVLIKAGVDIHTSGSECKHSEQALCVAARHGRVEMVCCLLDRGANPHPTPNAILCEAISGGAEEVVRVLLDGKTAYKPFPTGDPFWKRGNSFLARWSRLITTDPLFDRNVKPLFAAAVYGRLTILKMLIEKGWDPRIRGDYVFSEACGQGQLEMARYLKETGANIHANHELPIRSAVRGHHLKMTQWLVEHGASVEEGLKTAKQARDLEIIRWLWGVALSRKERRLLHKTRVPMGALKMFSRLLGIKSGTSAPGLKRRRM